MDFSSHVKSSFMWILPILLVSKNFLKNVFDLTDRKVYLLKFDFCYKWGFFSQNIRSKIIDIIKVSSFL